MNLDEARLQVQRGRGKGIDCPCCDQLAKEYRRKLNSAMARDLIWLVRRAEDDEGEGWISITNLGPKSLHKSRELAKLEHWKLIESLPIPSSKGARTSGIWRPTTRGIKFAKGKISVEKYVHLYNNQVQKFSGETTIHEALGNHFNFHELWSGPYS